MKIYLAGPMRGIKDFNFPAFRDAAAALRTYGGIEVFSPAEHDEEKGFDPKGTGVDLKGYSLRDALAADLDYITAEADAIVVLPGWEESLGARAEAFTAWCIGIPVYSLADWLAGKAKSLDALETRVPGRTHREDMLNEAKNLVTGDRNDTYGEPHQDFKRTADAASAYGYLGPGGKPLQPYDVALLITLVKISRLTWTPVKRDSWVDIAGYAACGYEAAILEGE